MELKDSKIIITGAGSGFGKAMALSFANLGAKIAGLDINQEALEELKNQNRDINIYLCDVTNHIKIDEIFQLIFLEFGGSNILINNAGIMKNSPLVNFLQRNERRHSIEMWNEVIDVNLNSVFYTTRTFVDLMLKNRCKGAIINISSIAANGNIGQTAYSASKAAVEAMTKVWAKELGTFGIRSVAIAPGFIDTSGTHNAMEEKMLNKWIEKTPLRRIGKIYEIVSATQFAIENDFLNGEVININGALTI